MHRVGARLAINLAWVMAALTVPRIRAVAADSSAAAVVDASAAEDGRAEEADAPEVPPEFEFSLELASA